jgi:hypothetical protein
METYDHLEIYCPHLGMMTAFHYCRRAQSSLPCRNLMGCWELRISVEDYLKENFSRADLESAFGGLPKTRLERIIEGVHRCREPETSDNEPGKSR